MTPVVCIGECMVELASQSQVQFVSATGGEAMGEAMRRAWRADEIDDSLACTVSGGSPRLYHRSGRRVTPLI